MRTLLDACRRRVGAPPRSLPLSLWRYLRPPPPLWMQASLTDPLWAAYRRERRLLKYGAVVWGRIVQANVMLFKPGKIDSAAGVIFSLDPSFDDGLDALEQISLRISALKGTTPDDPELAEIAARITDEYVRSAGRRVPLCLTDGREVLESSILVHRRHIPDGYLAGGFFPLLALPDEPGIVMILPSRFWPPRLVEIWRLIPRRQ